MRWVSLLLLVLGVGIAAAAGARNGPQLTAYRTANAVVTDLEALEETLGACEDEACRAEAREPREAAELIEPGQPVAEALAEATRRRDAIGLPTPGGRLAAWAGQSAPLWLLGVGFILVGAVLARRQAAAEASGEGEATEERVHFPAVLAEIRSRVDELIARAAPVEMDQDVPVLREDLDLLHADLILPVVDARGQMIARHGIAGFAEYFGPFSAGERNLARAWSALTDGHAVVAREALEQARLALVRAAEAWDAVEVAAGGHPWRGPGQAPHRHLHEEDVAARPPTADHASLPGSAALGSADVHGDQEE